MSIFRTIKRKVSQFFETDYWYRRRKINRYWYDEDDNKWHKCDKRSWPYRAQDILVSTWEGETDLWYTMLLKLDHMFWNLRKYGNEANYYFYSSDIEKFANDNDKTILAKKVLKSALLDEHTAFANNRLWLGSVKVDKKYSDNESIDFYLCLDKMSNGGYKLNLIAQSSQLIPADQIKKKNRLWTLSSYIDENGKRQFKHEEAAQYRAKSIEDLYEWTVDADKDIIYFVLNSIDLQMARRISSYAKEFDASWDINRTVKTIALDRLDQYCPDFAIEEIPSLSRELKQHATGNFVKCQQILHLRHLIKNLLNLDDSKYDYMWIDEPDDDKRRLSMKEARVHYEADEKLAYQNIMDYMLKYASNWWD